MPEIVGDYLVFATDQIVIGYTRYGHQYRCGQEMNDQNWMDAYWPMRFVGLPYVVLPSPINLAHPAYAEYYGRAAVTVRSKDSGGRTILRGASIEFAVAVSRKAENPGFSRPFYRTFD